MNAVYIVRQFFDIMAGSTKMKKGPVAVAVVVTLLLVGTVVKVLRTPGVAV